MGYIRIRNRISQRLIYTETKLLLLCKTNYVLRNINNKTFFLNFCNMYKYLKVSKLLKYGYFPY